MCCPYFDFFGGKSSENCGEHDFWSINSEIIVYFKDVLMILSQVYCIF